MDCFHVRTVGDQNILATFYRRLVLDDAVLGNPSFTNCICAALPFIPNQAWIIREPTGA